MTEQEVKDLLQRYEKGECTPQERAFLEQVYIIMAMEEALPSGNPDYNKIKRKVYSKLPTGDRKVFRITPFIRYAAAITLIGGAIWAYQHLQQKTSASIVTETTASADAAQIKPGSNKAILTLGNGRQIALDDANTGTIAQQGNIRVVKGTNGQLVYVISSEARNPLNSTDKRSLQSRDDGSGMMNTITVPNGGQYQVRLPDHSVVFLNAASQLKFPVSFTGDTRTVILSGEGYFEVTKDPGKPFIVNIAGKQQVRVLGTRFNVSAYPSETLKTTLAEGSVQLTSLSTNPPSKVTASNQPVILKPDQQATLLSTGFALRQVRAKNQIAWKDGLFVFRQTPLPEAMTQIARWYNVQVDLDHIPTVAINADISKTQTLSDFLAILKAGTGINILFTKERGLFIEQ